MFTSTGVLTQKELEARNEVKWEVYIKKVQIEARVLGDLSLNHIIPVAVRYQSVLLDNICLLYTSRYGIWSAYIFAGSTGLRSPQ